MFDQAEITLPTTAEFLAFLESQPRRKRYHYTSHDNCPIAQFMKSRGFTEVSVCFDVIRTDQKIFFSHPDIWNECARQFATHPKLDGAPTTQTFGAAAKRLKILMGG